VTCFNSPNEDFIAYVQESSPLFMLIGDGRLTPAQETRLRTLSTFGLDAGAKVNFAALPALYTSLLTDLYTKDVRCVRLNELIASDGMLRGLVVTRADDAEQLFSFTCTPAADAAARAAAAAAAFPPATATAAAYDAAATALTAAKLYTPRLAASAVAAGALLALKTPAAAAHAVLLLIHAILLQVRPYHHDIFAYAWSYILI